MTEYLILTLERALPLVWEYQRQIGPWRVDIGPYNVEAGLPNSRHTMNYSGTGTSITFNTTNHRAFWSFKTPALSDLPSLPSGIGRLKPRLYDARITASKTGSPTNILELWLADPTTKLPSQRIKRIDNTSGGYGERILYQGDAGQGVELEWDTWYSIVFIVTSADSSNYWVLSLYNSYTLSNWNTTTKAGYSTNGGQTWTAYDNYSWWGQIGVQHFFYPSPLKDELYRSSKAVNYYYSISLSGLPSNTYQTQSLLVINNNVIPIGGANPIPDSVEGKYDVSPVIYTTASISSAFQLTLTINKTAKYDKNPVEIDMFNIVEAYITRIDFLDTSVTNKVRLNKNFEQEFSGSGGTALTFDPPLLFWSAEVLSGRVKITAVCFE